ncbi:hypothetical protein Poli38472_014698 [Pythium oligandrum]|uniref:Amino acid transporter n=1 Tax=Pythium oligandrum TaxID=41045 RepID=A0A8K1CJC4_PYTOL|nr:hypothetical protein Poli38472_014698 [Pythium oligandrum]|eukprot:TMW63993.1 hypothetical protein Poli38472_014698 [Pythium oligandrum]
MENSRRPHTRSSAERAAQGGILLFDPEQHEHLDRQRFNSVQYQTTSFNSGGQTSITSDERSRPTVQAYEPRTNFKQNADAAYVRESYDHTNPLESEDVDTISREVRPVGASSGVQISVLYIMIGIALGVILGVVLYVVKASPLVAQWVALPGELFLRALKCLVLPYVFCAVAVAIGDIVYVGKVSVVGFQTVRIFITFWVATAAMGMGVALLFRHQFHMNNAQASTKHNVGFMCKNQRVMEMRESGTVACSGYNSTSATTFQIVDVNNIFQKGAEKATTTMGVSEVIRTSLESFVANNIISSFTNSYIPSIVTFAMLLGTIAGRNFFNKTRRVNYLYLVMLQLRNAFFLALEWVIWLTPVAVISLLAGAFAKNQASLAKFTDMYLFLIAILVAAVIQVGILFPFIVFILTRCNPYKHMIPMARAYLFAFGCSSSLATAPVTLSCIRKAKVCSPSIANFVISLGVCANASASAFYYPITIVFLAESSGLESEITALRLFALFVLSMVACVATPGIPNGALIAMGAFYKGLLSEDALPTTYAFVVAMDLFVDRIRTVCNVNDDVMALKVIAENTDETVSAEYLGQRF